MKPAPPLAITMGDPAGIGPELIIKLWMTKRQELPPLLIFACPELLEDRSRQLGLKVPIAVAQSGGSRALSSEKLNVVPIALSATSKPGVPDATNAPAVVDSIRAAVAAVQAGDCSAVVTSPIAKSVLYESGFDFPGHTEFLGHLAKLDHSTVMMLASDELRVVPVTLHVSLKEAVAQLDEKMIVHAVSETHRFLQQRYGISRPTIALSGLNPHAGEDGAMGDEEVRIIKPAMVKLSRQQIQVTGPWPADSLFHKAARADYDAAVCMTHDQALIPIKTIAFDQAVNVTMGLPFVRTSPDHGTAFDIAGQGIADPSSMFEAMKLANRLSGQATNSQPAA